MLCYSNGTDKKIPVYCWFKKTTWTVTRPTHTQNGDAEIALVDIARPDNKKSNMLNDKRIKSCIARFNNGAFCVRETFCRRAYGDPTVAPAQSPTGPMHVRYKLNETLWNVLQNEDEHRVLDNADTKIWRVNYSYLSHKNYTKWKLCSLVSC